MSVDSSLNRNWWRVCFVHGDQTKFYRQLYGGGRRAAIRHSLPRDGEEEPVVLGKGANCSVPQDCIEVG